VGWAEGTAKKVGIELGRFVKVVGGKVTVGVCEGVALGLLDG
jgi:hypothetical protein